MSGDRDSAARPGHAIEVVDLRKTFTTRDGRERGEVHAVDGVSFEVSPGSSMAIVGESGSGKTTLARALLGLVEPTGGKIVLGGVDCTRTPRSSREWRERARRIQIVFQDPYSSLDPRQSARACVEEVLHIHGYPKAEREGRIDELMDLVGLDDRQARALPGALSGGQRQRVAIARAMAVSPDVLILDEAVAALDVSIQAQILNLLNDVRAQTGITYLFISHDLAVVRQVSESAIVMWRGSIVERGATAKILDDPQHAYTKLLRDSVPHDGWAPGRVDRSALDALAPDVQMAPGQ